MTISQRVKLQFCDGSSRTAPLPNRPSKVLYKTKNSEGEPIEITLWRDGPDNYLEEGYNRRAAKEAREAQEKPFLHPNANLRKKEVDN